MKIENIKRYFIELKNLLWSFKWYMAVNVLMILLSWYKYLFPPAVNDAIWGSEATKGAWNYANQKLYLESIRYEIFICMLLFVLGISNMCNHPRLAKLVFLSSMLFALWNVWLI